MNRLFDVAKLVKKLKTQSNASQPNGTRMSYWAKQSAGCSNFFAALSALSCRPHG
jgi:hypothetical protein